MDNVIIKSNDLVRPAKGLPVSMNSILFKQSTLDFFKEKYGKWQSFPTKTVEKVAKKNIIDVMGEKDFVFVSAPGQIKSDSFHPLKINAKKMYNAIINCVDNYNNNHFVENNSSVSNDINPIEAGFESVNNVVEDKKEKIDVVKTADLNSAQLANDVQKIMSEPVNIEAADVPSDDEIKNNITDAFQSTVVNGENTNQNESDVTIEMPDVGTVSEEVIPSFVIPTAPQFTRVSNNDSIIKTDKFDENGNIKSNQEETNSEEKTDNDDKTIADVDKNNSLTDLVNASFSKNIVTSDVDDIPNIVINEMNSDNKDEAVSEEVNNDVIRGGDDIVVVPDIDSNERFVIEPVEENKDDVDNHFEEVKVEDYEAEDIPSYTSFEENDLHFDLSDATNKDFEDMIDHTDNIDELQKLQELVLKSKKRVESSVQRQKSTKDQLASGREALRLSDEEYKTMRNHTGELHDLLVQKIKENDDYAQSLEEDSKVNEQEAIRINAELKARDEAKKQEALKQQKLNEMLSNLTSNENEFDRGGKRM